MRELTFLKDIEVRCNPPQALDEIAYRLRPGQKCPDADTGSVDPEWRNPVEMGLKEKVVVVTGASSGIGRATAVAFAAEGAHVVESRDWQKRLRGELPSLLDKTRDLDAI